MSKASTTVKRKSILMRMFMLDYEKITAPQRITIELIRSAEWKRMRDEYVKLWMPVLIAHESDKADRKAGVIG